MRRRHREGESDGRLWFNGRMSATTTAPAPFAVIPPAEAARLRDGGQAVIVDVREPDEYRQRHVPGAALFPTSCFSVSGFPAAAPGRRTLVLCKGGGRASKVAAAMCASGRSDVAVIEGGITGWTAAGLPTQGDARAPMPIMRQVMIMAGSLLAAFTALGFFVHPAFLAGTAFVSLGLVFAGVSGICPMASMLGRMPWNRAPAVTAPPAGASCATGGCGCSG